MKLPLRVMALVALAPVAAAPVVQRPARRFDPAAVEFFEKKVRPVLAANCFNCHSADNKANGGLRVDDRNGLVAGGNSGPAVVPGHPEKSLLLKAVHKTGKLKMPPDSKLSEAQIDDLTKWIADGAAWPGLDVPAIRDRYAAKYKKLREGHWAWQPLTLAPTPAVRDATWPRGDADRFLLAAMEAKDVAPVGDADRVTLLRRLTFDLTGLPPTPGEVDAFVEDASPDAVERVVDRLLASPGYGERWGRHWLDVARYGESTGSARNLPFPHAWRYRDYVVASFDADKPFDRLIREQIAGDLLPYADRRQRDEQAIATGFLALGVKDVNQRFLVRYVMDNVDEQIDAVTRGFLGLTVSCARCHDHKFDPVPQTDYYALAGIFTSTDLCAGLRNKMGGGGLDYYDNAKLLKVGDEAAKPDARAQAEIERLKKEVAEATAAFEAIKGKPAGKQLNDNGQPRQQAARQKMTRLQGELLSLSDFAGQGRAAMGVREGPKAADTELRIRGEAERLGPTVPRGFLSLLRVEGAPKVGGGQSGRLELAEWLASPDNPLTARVIVNRVWHHLFGAGLVRSVDNFGVTGEPPSHPELLDRLAARFVADGWSIKKLVRSLATSRAYGLAGDAPKGPSAADPANRLVWRHSPRRLAAEEIRDAMLVASGAMDRARPTGSPAMTLRVIELANNGPEAKRVREAGDRSDGRSVFLPLVRLLVPQTLEAFDPAEQGMVSGARDVTTVAPQALFLLNDPFVRRNAKALAGRLMERDGGDEGRIDAAYRATLGRPATAKEVARARAYLADYAEEAGTEAAWGSFCQALFGSSEFRYVR